MASKMAQIMEMKKESDEEFMKNYLIQLIDKKIKKLTKPILIALAKLLGICIYQDNNNKQKINETLKKETSSGIKTLSCTDNIEIIKKLNLGIQFEVKYLFEISIDYLINLDLCLTLDKFFSENSKLKNKFNNSCDLVHENNSIISKNCIPEKIQGLYILTISKHNIDYIIKLGSFAESQGMHKRITSFGGGNYDTGSATNKWFQKFVKKAMEEGYTSKFTYYNKLQEKMEIENLDDEKIEIVPYVVRQLETELFVKYNSTNNNIPPIFGSNCL